MMRRWIVVALAVALLAALLPITRTVHTVIGDAQIVYALLLLVLLVQRTAMAIRAA